MKFYEFSLSSYCFIGRFGCMCAGMKIGFGVENSDLWVYPLWEIENCINGVSRILPSTGNVWS
jgi:hypothetical protein